MNSIFLALVLGANSAVFQLNDTLPLHQEYDLENAVCYTEFDSNLIGTDVCVVPIKDWRKVQAIKRASARLADARRCSLNENLMEVCR